MAGIIKAAAVAGISIISRTGSIKKTGPCTNPAFHMPWSIEPGNLPIKSNEGYYCVK
jgi:hypothetical protein